MASSELIENVILSNAVSGHGEGRGGNPAGQRRFECNGAKVYAANELVQNNSGATLFSSHWFRGSLGVLAGRGENHQEMAVYASHPIADRKKTRSSPPPPGEVTSWF